MILIVRLSPVDSKEAVWNDIKKRYKAKAFTKKVTPLYMSQQEKFDFTSVFFNAKDVHLIEDFLIDELPKIKSIKHSRTTVLLRSRFFPMPKKRPKHLARYMLSLTLKPEKISDVYNAVIEAGKVKDVIPTYVAFTTGEHDMLISLLAEKPEDIDTYFSQVLEPTQGIAEKVYSRVERSLRLTDVPTWKTLQHDHLVKGSSEDVDEDFDWVFVYRYSA